MKKNVVNNLFILLTGLLLNAGLRAQPLPYQNPALTVEERVKDLMSRLTLEEKASLMFDQSPAIPRLGINKFNWWSEALHGLANNDSVTVFPEPIGMAASFVNRVIELKKSLSPDHRSAAHECGSRYKSHVAIAERFPYQRLLITLEHSNAPREAELIALKTYYDTFGELPPFNRSG